MKFLLFFILTVSTLLSGDFEEGLKAEKLYNFDVAHKYFLKAAQKNNPVAQLKVAYHYQIVYDEATDSDPVKFVYWMNKAATNGNADALYELASLYDADANDYNITHNPKKAHELYQLAANKGNAFAQDFIGDHLFNLKKIPDAILWYEKASAQNHIPSKFKLIYIYGFLNFQIIPTDNIKTNTLIKQAFNVEYPNDDDHLLLKDLISLSKKYPNGLLLSAKQGDKNAQYEVAKNIVFTARFWQNNQWIKPYVSQQETLWLKKASAQGHKKANELLEQKIQFYNMTDGFVKELKKGK